MSARNDSSFRTGASVGCDHRRRAQTGLGIHNGNGWSGRFSPFVADDQFLVRRDYRAKTPLPDAGLVNEGLRVMKELARPAPTDVLLATDLHADNVLRAQREPWLAIDPKPFVGDRSYDPVQHLMNCETHLHRNPAYLVERIASLTEVDPERLRLWTFARAAADPREDWTNTRWIDIAKALSL